MTGGDKHVSRALARSLLAACLHFYGFVSLFCLQSGKRFAKELNIFYWTPLFFRNQENGGADMTIFWSGTVDGSKAFQHFLAPAFMGCYVFILFCWMSKSINEVGHRQLCSSAGDGAMASQVQSSVDGWESHRCKGNLIRGVFSKVPQISGERELSDLVLTTPDVFGTQASRLPDSTILNILLISRRGRGLDFLATMQICNNKIKNKRKWGEHYRTTDPIRKKKLLTKWKEFV